MPPHTFVDAMIILERGDRVLLAERLGTGYADGRLNLPIGKVDPGENALDAAVREAREEVGVTIDPAVLRPVHVMHFRNPEGQARVGWFFATARWDGEPVNAEPHKCAGIGWHRADQLPGNIVRYNALGIAHYLKGEPFSFHGW
ncbi:NUDIX hydrolase [Streptomyces litchfieldiae]|uniref:NUDIX domain-containing protein n=1 Tax=Streptomyces litchfieldiae TaxID=3075543 RepID=A0ABU2MQW2_9ACTN|nr:NUDIX domain-containing protein [Streptomyces sp. DSM 44938]MDT0344016.1 NUDIX domain-containing protein [Streptomyces sp. DSM 44938]